MGSQSRDLLHISDVVSDRRVQAQCDASLLT